jgi:hypothetical protein
VGWPFWIPIILTTIPFTVLFAIWATKSTHEQIPWWQWIYAVPIGLMPAMVLGLVVQTIWSIGVAASEGRFDWFDAMFVMFLVLLSAGVGLLYWRFEQWIEELLLVYIFVIMVPIVRFYVSRRIHSSAR